MSAASVSEASGNIVFGAREPMTRGGNRAHLRMTTRGKIVFTILAALPVAGVGLALGGGVATASNEVSPNTFEYVQVESGQSLWQLAESLAPEADPREVVSDIVHLNQLPTSDVQPGQKLAIPSAYSD